MKTPKWQRLARARYRKQLRKCGVSKFANAMIDFERLICKKAAGHTIEFENEAIEQLQILRRLKVRCRRKSHGSIIREERAVKNQTALINAQFAKLRALGIQVDDL